MNRDEWKWIWLGLALTVCYLAPLLLLGQDAHVRIHDNLDSNVVWYKNLVDSQTVYAGLDATVPNLLGGVVSRNAFVSEWTGIIWLYQAFPPFAAYIISQLLVRMFAFLGMYLLLRDHLSLQLPRFLLIGVAVLFAWTPFWPSGMLSTLGMPLLLWAYLNLWHSKRIGVSLLTLLLVPFYSSFVLGIVFFLAVLAGVSLFLEWRKRTLHLLFWLAVLGQTILYVVIEYRLVYSMLWAGEATSRDQFELGHNGVFRTIRLFGKHLLFGHTHAEAAQTPIILLFVLSVLVLILLKKEPGRLIKRLTVFLLALSLWYACWFYVGWNPLKERVHLLQTFNFARFHFIQPMIWYVLFALALDWLWQQGLRKVVLTGVLMQTIVLILWNPEVIYRQQPSYAAFYAERQFAAIKTYIGRPTNRYAVISLGMHPAIAQYNGMRTLDGYVNFYPLTYKKAFRKIIAGELERDAELRKYYDHWGNRVYLFSHELGKQYDYTKAHPKTIQSLHVDSRQLKQMGGAYVISAVQVDNAAALGWVEEKTFRDAQSAWIIHLYRVTP